MKNREHKYRALCSADGVKKMVYFEMTPFDNGLAAWPLPNNISHIDEYYSPLLEFTGLHDKTGKEIYELNEINNKYRVVYKFNRYILQSISNSDIFEEIKENDRYEITGEYSPIP